MTGRDSAALGPGLRAGALGSVRSSCSASAANWLAAGLALAGNVYYVLIYTLLLKRRTPQNIVIGGAAGAFPPLVGWAAVTGNLTVLPVLMFAIIYLLDAAALLGAGAAEAGRIRPRGGADAAERRRRGGDAQAGRCSTR